MKIGIDARMYGAKNATGIGVYIENLIKNLLAIDQQNQYHLFLKEPEFSQLQFSSQNVIKVKADFPWYSYAEQFKLPKLIKAQKLDLMHFPHFNVPIFYSKPYVLTIHDITPRFFPGPLVKRSAWRKMAYNLVFTTGLRRAKKIISISNHTADNLKKYFKFNHNKIEIIYPGVTLAGESSADLSKETVLQKYGISKPYIFYLGVWRDHKNLPTLISAFEKLKKDYQFDCQLVLGGQADERFSEIQEKISSCEFKSDIVTPGFIDKKDLPILYGSALSFVLPSFEEGFGLVAVESIFYGTPVIASNTTSVPEILGDGGLYFNPDKPTELAELINKIRFDSSLAAKLVENGRQKIFQFNWQKTATKTLAVYNTAYSIDTN
ncbi:MAG: glycosyltransferase family 4 protein [Candidatus Buchananbacteria bacterium]|nr:glycosyltransferase family 4 protein [Candidatus Buchananbacteria bacterium]